MLHTVGVAMARHRVVVLIIWIVFVGLCLATALFGVTGQSLFDRLSSSGPSVDGEASEAAALTSNEQTANTESLSLLVYGINPTSPELNAILTQATADLEEIPGVTQVVNPITLPLDRKSTRLNSSHWE